MSHLLVISKTENQTITIETDPYEPTKLTPRIARKAAVLSKSIPCLVTDGFICYRVTKQWVVIKDINDLKHGLVLKIIDWMITHNV